MRITKVTTKTGDDGKTSLADGKRVKKNHVIIDALGELDHLNAVIGWAEVASSSKKNSKDLQLKIKNLGNKILILTLNEINFYMNR